MNRLFALSAGMLLTACAEAPTVTPIHPATPPREAVERPLRPGEKEPEARPVWEAAQQDRGQAEHDAKCAKERAEHDASMKREIEAQAARSAAERASIAARDARRKARDDAEAWIAKRCRVIKAPIYETKTYVDAGGFVKAARAIVDYEEKTVCPSTTPAEVISNGCLEEDGASWVRDAADGCGPPTTSSIQNPGQVARDVKPLPPPTKISAGCEVSGRPGGETDDH